MPEAPATDAPQEIPAPELTDAEAVTLSSPKRLATVVRQHDEKR